MGIGEDTPFICASGSEFGDDRPFGPGLEPVQGVGRNRALVPGMEHGLFPD